MDNSAIFTFSQVALAAISCAINSFPTFDLISVYPTANDPHDGNPLYQPGCRVCPAYQFLTNMKGVGAGHRYERRPWWELTNISRPSSLLLSTPQLLPHKSVSVTRQNLKVGSSKINILFDVNCNSFFISCGKQLSMSRCVSVRPYVRWSGKK